MVADLDKQIGRLVDTTKNAQVNFAINNDSSESGQNDEDDLIKDIANNFSTVEITGPSIGKKIANIVNNILFKSVSREKLVQKLEKHSLKIKKCTPEIWSKMLKLKTRSKDRKTPKMQGCILKILGTTSKVADTLLELENNKSLDTTTLGKNVGTMGHDCTD